MRYFWLLILLVTPLRAEPLSPVDELKTLRTLPGFRVELVASEPDVVDPVAMCFDHHGDLYVCEMIGYPNAGIATGKESRGRIRKLVDRDRDGRYETSSFFAEGLRFPTGIIPWKSGFIVCVAPDIIYLEDTNRDGKADLQRVLYTGFALPNIQQIVNSPRWGLDDTIHVVCGNAGGEITCPELPRQAPTVLRGRGMRFDPTRPGSLEPVSGGGQYGLTQDPWGHWFTNTNNQHLRQIVLPDHYLRRNPYLAASTVTFDIPEHGAACQLFRISPFEAWRVERTSRRKDSPDAKRFPSTELVPGGYATSSCSPLYYSDDLFPAEFRDCIYFCDPANNLISRDRLKPNGPMYAATRADEGREFLASIDNWCRPVHLCSGPEGALYVLDFYREVIETPLSLPDDIKKRLNLESRSRGRIWRIVPDSFQQARDFPPLETVEELVIALQSPTQWRRNTARRRLAERRPSEAIPLLRAALEKASSVSPIVQVEILHTLATLKGLESRQLQIALTSDHPGVREAALRLGEPFYPKDRDLARRAISMAEDPSGMVRLQLAFSLGEMPADLAGPVLARMLLNAGSDPVLPAAILSSSAAGSVELLEVFLQSKTRPHPALLRQIAVTAGAQSEPRQLLKIMQKVATLSGDLQGVLLEGLGEGMRNTRQSLSRLWIDPPQDLQPLLDAARPVFDSAARTATSGSETPTRRLSAIRLIGYGPPARSLEILRDLLHPRHAAEFQAAAVRSIGAVEDPQVSGILLQNWDSYSPTIRREVVEVLSARPERVTALLDAVEKKQIPSNSIDSTRAESLRKHPQAALAKRAQQLLINSNTDRVRVVESYQSVLDLKGDVERGRQVFRKNCTACHQLEKQGQIIGADLMASLRNKTKPALLIDILDPSREVDPRYVNYQITTTTGRTVSGLLAVETATSITLRRGDNAEDTILRNQIDEIRATSKSLMPEDFEKQIDRQAMADLLEYLLAIR